jgi:hypothetical protein
MSIMAGISSSLVVSLLFAGVAALGYTNYQVSALAVDTTPAAAPAVHYPLGKVKAAKEAVLELAPAPRSIAEFSETTTKPIFFSGRRAPEKPKPKPVVIEAKAVPAPIAVPAPEPLRLVGVMGNAGGRSILVRSSTDTSGTWLRVGDEYRGWQLREVSIDRAVVEAQGERRELRLYAVSGKTVAR